MDKSKAILDGCLFQSANRYSIYLYRNSVAEIKNTKFLAQKGKAIFLITGCQSHLINCQFESCQGGAISIADSSEAFIDICNFFDIGKSAIYAIKNSTAYVKRSNFKKCNGNGVNFEYSTGYVYNCRFNNFLFPAIACYGPKSTPVIFNSVIKNCQTFAIVSRDCSSPIFSKLKIYNVKSNGFSISDFSEPYIENCVLKKIQKTPFCTYNGATSIINNCLVKYCNENEKNSCLFKVFTEGNVIFQNNSIFAQSLKLSVMVNFFGFIQIDKFVNNFLLDKTSSSKGHAIQIDENNHAKVEVDETGIKERVFDDIFEEEEEDEEQLNQKDKFEYARDQELCEIQKDNSIINEIEKYQRESQKNNLLAKQRKFAQFYLGPVLDRLEPIPYPLDLPKPRPEIDVNSFGQKKINNHCHCEKVGTCLKCHKNPADYVITPCGHKVLCKSCASKINDEKKNKYKGELYSDYFCPLCEVPIHSCTEEFVEERCSICLDNVCDTIILPCGHRCICYQCANKLWNEKSLCPLCQTRIISFRHIFPIYNGK